MPRWTSEQLDAINKDGQNIIVSAGAGSGKTAVLTERVIEKLRKGININELLILTFTNAAAKEMKERIKVKLKEDSSLKKQLDLIDTSFITTFDSFALSMVKKYHYVLNISSDVGITDSTIIRLEKEKILDEIFEEMYQNKNPLFEKMINDLCIKDDKQIKKYLLNVDNKLNLKINKIEYLNNYVENYFNDDFIKQNIDKYIKLISDNIDKINLLLDDIKYLVDSEYYVNLEEVLMPLLHSKIYEEYKDNCYIKLPPKPRNSDGEVGIIKDEIKKIVDCVQELCKYDSLDELKNRILLTYDYVTIICNILKKLESKMETYKREKEAFEFNDIIKMSIKVLETDTNVNESVKKTFKEIMVDEYQDTSDLQEYFIKLIANNNVYMVGDIKQSIYRFRNANPKIFKDKYDTYSLGKDGIKIDLNKNFRSRNEVVKNINLIFDYIMDDMVGGADYKTSHEMLFGNLSYEESKPKQNYNMSILMYDYEKDSKYSIDEIEYFIAINDIKKKIDSKFLIFDKEINTYRPCKYSDFSILIDRATSFSLARKIFDYMHIPLTIYRDESITSSYLLLVIRNVIKLIIKEYKEEYDTTYRYLFMSIARSFLCSYDDEKIFNIIQNDIIKNDAVIIKIKELKKDLENISISNLLYQIYDKFSVYENIIKMGDVQNSLVILEYLYDICTQLEKMGYTIFELNDYLENIMEKQYDIKLNTSKNSGDSVKIMTIHASKGLEFPICYFIGLNKNFNFSDIRDNITYSDNYGIVAPYFKYGIGKTIYVDLLKNDYVMDEISEKIRLFYVALTRAKEKMLFILPSNTRKINKPFNLNMRKNYRCFADIIYSLNSYLDHFIEKIDLNTLPLTKDYNKFKKEKISIESTKEKISFKQINLDEKIIEKEKFSKDINQVIDKETQKNLDLGLLFHETLEYMDFKNPNYNMIENLFIKKKIQSFLNHKLLSNILNASIYKETEFMYKVDNNIYHGIIDLMIEYDDYIDIIDYKLKYTLDENYKKQLKGYFDYVSRVKKKQINIYLYSILNETFHKVDIIN